MDGPRAAGNEWAPQALLATGGVEVFLARLDVAPDLACALESWLRPDELLRARRCRVARERRRFTVARAGLRQLLGSRLRAPPGAIEFAYGAHGKPALAGRHAATAWHFNLSHCEELAIYALARGRRVGIDIEAVRGLSDADAVAAQTFSRSENAAYRRLAARDKPLGFFNCWTRKEAFVKALGAGMFHPLDAFDVSLAPHEPARILRVGDTPGAQAGWFLASCRPAPGFVAALVAERQFACRALEQP